MVIAQKLAERRKKPKSPRPPSPRPRQHITAAPLFSPILFLRALARTPFRKLNGIVLYRYAKLIAKPAYCLKANKKKWELTPVKINIKCRTEIYECA